MCLITHQYSSLITSCFPDHSLFQLSNSVSLALCHLLYLSSDIGYPLFLDVVRTVKPTHIIQLRNSNYTLLGEVPLLSHDILYSAPGWSLKAKDPTPPQQLIKDVALFSEMIRG